MATNEFLPFGQDVDANVESQADYTADDLRGSGNQPGVAISAFNNKALRQACWIASILAQFISDTSGDDVLDDGDDAALLASMASTWPGSTTPTLTKLTATGSTTGYLFTCTSFNATVGAVYSNNGNNYTVLATQVGGTQLFTSQVAAPLSSGTLTKQSGTGDSTITFSKNQALATYTTPANTKYIRVKAVGAGGGGGGGGSGGGSDGVAGSVTAFGSSMIICNGGGLGQTGGSGVNNVGGTAFLGIGPVGIAVAGGGSQGIAGNALSSGFGIGSNGGVSPLGGAGAGAGGSTAGGVNGSAAAANSGSGGGGGNSGNAASGYGGNGGGAGGFVDALIASPVATYYYTVGSGGTGGANGTSGGSGGNGAAGIILVEEFYS